MGRELPEMVEKGNRDPSKDIELWRMPRDLTENMSNMRKVLVMKTRREN